MSKLKILALAAVLGMISCQSHVALPLLSASAFDTTVNGQAISLYTLTNPSGATVQITNYGGRVVSLWMPDRDGNFRDVVLGFDNIADYLSSKSGNQGAVVGRYANRIEDKKFTIDSVEYLLAGNKDAQIAPIGVPDFNRAIFTPKLTTNDQKESSLELSYLSPDGEAGFPGNADVTVIYTLTNDNELKIEYIVTTDRPTVVSLTNHSFFNLRGGEGDISDYELYVNADSYLEIKEGTIPTGNIVSVEGTPLDFRTPTPIGARIDDDFYALKIGGGYDQCFVLNVIDDEPTHVVTMYDPVSGINVDVSTNQPGMQLYTANKLNGLVGKGGKSYARRAAACLEMMHFPDSPNHDNFPSTVLRPGEVYDYQTIYKFSAR